MATVELTGPLNCAECGTGLTEEIVTAGDAGPFIFTIRGHMVEVPGLYVCTPCAGAIMVGEKESGVTWAAAADFLENNFAPRVMTLIERSDDMAEIIMAATRLEEIAQMAFILRALEMLKDEPGGLDFIPECTGDCGHEEEAAHPRDMAPMN
jgi:hypothetical protein